MPLNEQQEYLNQIALINKKLVHLKETLKIEDEEKKLLDKIKFHQDNSSHEAELLARKNEETDARNLQLQEEEGGRRAIINKMVKETGGNLTPIKDALIHFEGKVINILHKLRRSPDLDNLKF